LLKSIDEIGRSTRKRLIVFGPIGTEDDWADAAGRHELMAGLEQHDIAWKAVIWPRQGEQQPTYRSHVYVDLDYDPPPPVFQALFDFVVGPAPGQLRWPQATVDVLSRSLALGCRIALNLRARSLTHGAPTERAII
jgi:hypothetical protein